MSVDSAELLAYMRFTDLGQDPDALDHHLFQSGSIVISVPAAGCLVEDIPRLIWHAGASRARRDIAEKRAAYLDSLK